MVSPNITVSGPTTSVTQEDLEAAPTRSDGYQSLSTDPVRNICTAWLSGILTGVQNAPMAYKQNINAGAYRTLFPFFLIIVVILLLVWRLILSPGLANPVPTCPKNTIGYWVQPGDSCWDIAKLHGCSLDRLRELNPSVKCESLMPGTTVCLPYSSPPPR